MSEQRRIAVVGGGLAGLAAGLTLKRAGARVELFERTRRLGGKATSFSLDGVEVDNGQHVVLRCCTEFMSFLEEIGMGSCLWVQPRFEVTLLARGRHPAKLRESRLPAPLHLAPSFLRYPLLSARDKLRVARALAAARRGADADCDMAEWLRRTRQTPAALRAFWEPFLVPALNAPLDEVSARDGLFVICTAFLAGSDAARIGWTTVPLGRLADEAASSFDAVHRRTGVTSLIHEQDTAVAVVSDGRRHAGFDGFVLALPPRRLAAVIGAADPQLALQASTFRTNPIVDVHLRYEVAAPLLDSAGFAALIGSSVQWVFEKSPGYLCCSLSAASSAVTRPEADLAEQCHAELSAFLPALAHMRPARFAATRDADATFVPAPGVRRPGPATVMRNVVIAGAWTDTGWPATMESAVRSGRAAARALLAGSRSSSAAARVAEYAHAV